MPPKVKEIPGCVSCPMRSAFPENTFVAPQRGGSLRLQILEAPGETEADTGVPATGGAGQWLNVINRKVGLKREDLNIANVIQCRPPGNVFPTSSEATYLPRGDGEKAVRHCLEHHVWPLLKERPWKRIDILGDTPLKWVVGKTDGIMRWRGSPLAIPGLTDEPITVPTLHPAYIARDQVYSRVAAADLAKGLQIPPEYYDLKPDLDTVRSFDAKTFAFDIETTWGADKIFMVGLCAEAFKTIVVPFQGEYIHELIRIFKDATTVVGQNLLQFDLPVLQRFGVQISATCGIWDIMLMQHLLMPDLPHDLQFISSQFTQKPAWKHGAKENFELYCARDTDVTLQIFEQLMPRLQRNNLLELYQNVQVPLAKICRLMHDTGFKVNPKRILDVRKKLIGEMATYETALPDDLRTRMVLVHKRELAPPRTYSPKTGKLLKYVTSEVESVETPWQSGDRIRNYLYGTLGLPEQLHPKTRQVTTDKGAIGKLSRRLLAGTIRSEVPGAVEAVAAIAKLRKTSTLINSFIKQESSDVGRMFPHFNVHGTASGRLSSSDPNCFTADTEVLTPKGWYRFDSLPSWLTVAQWDAGKVSFVRPIGYIKRENQETIRLHNQHIDLAVTKNHRCLLQNRKTGAFKIVEAKDYPEDFCQINAGVYTSQEPKWISNALITFACAIQADGYWENHAVSFGLKKVRKIERLKACLQLLKLEFKESFKQTGESRFYIKPCQTLAYLKGLLGGDGKHFGGWLLDLAPDQMDFFLEEVFYWDGCITRMNHYSSNEESNADWVQTLFVLRGQRANKRVYKAVKNLNYQVDVTHRDYSLTTNIEKEILPAQDVFCVSVPSAFLLVRRNGKVVVTGNCQNIPETARYIYVPSHSDWSLIEADFSGIENRLTALFANDTERLARLAQPGFNEHKWMTSQYFGIPIEDVEKDNDKDAPYGKAKRISHGCNYGMGVQKICNLFDLEFKEVKELHARWKEINAPTVSWQAATAAEAKKTGVLTTVFGRKRWFWTSSLYTESLSFLPQSAGADVIFRAMIGLMYERIGWPEEEVRKVVEIYEPLPEPARLLLQVHDSLIIEAPNSMIEEVVRIVKRVMQQPWRELGGYSIPVEVKTGESWGECEAI